MDDDDDDDGDDSFDFSNPASGAVFELEERNRLADECIARYTIEHCTKDGALSAAGYIPIPLAGFAGMAAGIAVQIPLYKRMAVDLGKIYLATPEELRSTTEQIFVPQTNINAAMDLQAEITTELLGLIIGDTAGELILSALTSAIPIPLLSGMAGTALDLHIARKMTRRIGLTTSIFYQNQARWAGGGRKATYGAAKHMAGGANDVRHEVDEVRLGLVKRAKTLIAMLMEMQGATRKQVRKIMIERKVPPDIIDEAMGSI